MMNKKLNKILWRTLEGVIITILNGCGIAILIMMFMSSETNSFKQALIDSGLFTQEQITIILSSLNQHIDVESFFEGLTYIQKGGIIFGETVGFILSVIIIKFIWQNKKDDERADKQNKMFRDVLTIKETKENDKLNKDINKYL